MRIEISFHAEGSEQDGAMANVVGKRLIVRQVDKFNIESAVDLFDGENPAKKFLGNVSHVTLTADAPKSGVEWVDS